MAVFEFRILTDDAGITDREMVDQALAAIDAAIHINVMHLKRTPQDVCILSSGRVKYDSKNRDVLLMVSEISTIPILKKSGIGLCIDIVAADVACKVFNGTDAWPHVFPTGGGIFHVVTRGRNFRGDVVEYDPSSELEVHGYVISNQPNTCRQRSERRAKW